SSFGAKSFFGWNIPYTSVGKFDYKSEGEFASFFNVESKLYKIFGRVRYKHHGTYLYCLYFHFQFWPVLDHSVENYSFLCESPLYCPCFFWSHLYNFICFFNFFCSRNSSFYIPYLVF